MFCPRCGYGQPKDHSFCVDCGATLPAWHPSGGPKESRWYVALPVVPQDPPGAAIRVSRYAQEFDWATEEGSVRVPGHHVRFSVWVADQVLAAASLSEEEAHALARFVLGFERGDEQRNADPREQAAEDRPIGFIPRTAP